jgi:hypothetical protein
MAVARLATGKELSVAASPDAEIPNPNFVEQGDTHV